MKIRPLQDRVILRRLKNDNVSPGGIIIPDSATENPVQGKVIAVGPGKTLKDGKVLPMDLKVGDTVLFGKYAGNEVKSEGEEYVVMRQEDVIGVIEE